jgi:Transglutaminase-like superfamily
MTSDNKEISALFNLLDDPDEEIFSAVSEKICSYGKPIIPQLELLWENTHSTDTQDRIEQIIHRLQFADLKREFANWASNPDPELLFGAFLVARFQFPDADATPILTEVEKIRRNIWLELNSYLTPLEKINIVNGILYKFHKYFGVEIAYTNTGDFLINKLIEAKKGNSFNIGILYVVLSRLLDLPVHALMFPRQFVLGYFDTDLPAGEDGSSNFDRIKFFIDPVFGNVVTHKDVETFFNRISVPATASYFRPLSNKRIIQSLLYELVKCYDKPGQQYRQDELLELAAMLDD